MSDFTPVRIGLVGYGFGGRYFHAPFLADAPECQFLGVVTTSPERATQVRADHPDVDVLPDVDALVAAGAEAVVICSPVDTHSQLTDRAIDAGLAVVCDKPFALDAGAARRSVERAARAGTLLVPYQNRRWDSDFLTVGQLARDGRLGAIRRFESRFERFKSGPGPGAAGGGVLLDFGSHLVDQALVLLGPVATVTCEWAIRPSGRDDDVFVALTHTSGARSHLWGSYQQHAPGPRFRVTGTDGTYVSPSAMDGQEAALLAGRRPSDDRWGWEPETTWGRLFSNGTVSVVPTVPGAWDSFYPAFARALRAGHQNGPVNPADAIATARVLDAARESARRGETVRLPAE